MWYTAARFVDNSPITAEPVPIQFGRARGMIGFDKELFVFVCAAEVNDFLKTFKSISANKIARGVLSPIQVKDFGFAYA